MSLSAVFSLRQASQKSTFTISSTGTLGLPKSIPSSHCSTALHTRQRPARWAHASLRTSRRRMYTIAGSEPLARNWALLGGFGVAVVLLWTTLDHRKLQTETSQLPNTMDREDPATGIKFPARIAPPSLKITNPNDHLVLVGLGVRTVSFLGVKVYSMGVYISPEAIKKLPTMPGWKGFTKESLMASSAPEDDALKGEKLMSTLLELPYDFVLRIVPTRSTEFAHLRDGFARSLVTRIKSATKMGILSESDGEKISKSVDDFKSLFPAGKVPKAHDLLIIRHGQTGELSLEYEGKLLGTIEDSFVSRELLLAYFADKNVISKIAKESVAEGLHALLGVK